MNESPTEIALPFPVGSRNPNAKLDEDAVEVIRENADMPTRELATFFKVTPRNINYICNRATWTHI